MLIATNPLTVTVPAKNFLLFPSFSRLISWPRLAELAVLSMATALLIVISAIPLTGRGAVPVCTAGVWFRSGLFESGWAFSTDALTSAMLIVVLTVSTLVHLYSTEYMDGDPHINRFISYLALFTFFMFLLITAESLTALFLGWEGVGLCSYLLISFWFTRIPANKAAIKAMVVNRIADLAFTIGILAAFFLFQGVEFQTALPLAPYLDQIIRLFGVECTTQTPLAVCLFIGAMGKSAQYGLHTWLPDAMEGPTPVSALIHAATMVTAGVFLLIRCSALLETTATTLLLITVIGGLTAFMAATSGLFQSDLKKVIAYSTCSQLGYMVFACGCSAYALSLFHLANHAFFKALLFLGAGAVIHALSNEQDMRYFGGLMRYLPYTYAMFLIGSLALTGFPFLTGFYSKDLILEVAAGSQLPVTQFVHWAGLITAFFTAYYSFRLLTLVFYSAPRLLRPAGLHSHELPTRMAVALATLTGGSVFFGYYWRDLFVGFGCPTWAGAVGQLPETTGGQLLGEYLPLWLRLLPLFGTITAIGLLLFAHSIHNEETSHPFQFPALSALYRFLVSKWGFDAVYNRNINSPLLGWAYTGPFRHLDKGALELAGPTGGGYLMRRLSALLVRLQTGRVTDYATVIVVGLLTALLLSGEEGGGAVLAATIGTGYGSANRGLRWPSHIPTPKRAGPASVPVAPAPTPVAPATVPATPTARPVWGRWLAVTGLWVVGVLALAGGWGLLSSPSPVWVESGGLVYRLTALTYVASAAPFAAVAAALASRRWPDADWRLRPALIVAGLLPVAGILTIAVLRELHFGASALSQPMTDVLLEFGRLRLCAPSPEAQFERYGCGHLSAMVQVTTPWLAELAQAAAADSAARRELYRLYLIDGGPRFEERILRLLEKYRRLQEQAETAALVRAAAYSFLPGLPAPASLAVGGGLALWAWFQASPTLTLARFLVDLAAVELDPPSAVAAAAQGGGAVPAPLLATLLGVGACLWAVGLPLAVSSWAAGRPSIRPAGAPSCRLTGSDRPAAPAAIEVVCLELPRPPHRPPAVRPQAAPSAAPLQPASPAAAVVAPATGVGTPIRLSNFLVPALLWAAGLLLLLTSLGLLGELEPVTLKLGEGPEWRLSGCLIGAATPLLLWLWLQELTPRRYLPARWYNRLAVAGAVQLTLLCGIAICLAYARADYFAWAPLDQPLDRTIYGNRLFSVRGMPTAKEFSEHFAARNAPWIRAECPKFGYLADQLDVYWFVEEMRRLFQLQGAEAEASFRRYLKRYHESGCFSRIQLRLASGAGPAAVLRIMVGDVLWGVPVIGICLGVLTWWCYQLVHKRFPDLDAVVEGVERHLPDPTLVEPTFWDWVGTYISFDGAVITAVPLVAMWVHAIANGAAVLFCLLPLTGERRSWRRRGGTHLPAGRPTRR